MMYFTAKGLTLLCFIYLASVFHNGVFLYAQPKDFSYGIYGGVNFSKPVLAASYDVLSQAGYGIPGSKNYSGWFANYGFQAGGIGYLKLTENIAVAVLPGLWNYRYYYQVENQWVDNTTIQTANYNISNRLWGVSLPVQGYYVFNPDNKLQLFATAGGKYDFLFNGLKRGKYAETTTVNGLETGTYNESFKSRSNRMFKRSNFQNLLGMGVSYQFESYTLSAEVDFLKGWNVITKPANRYSDPQNLYTHPDIQDDVKLNNLVVNVALLYKLFKAPQKLKCVTP